LDTTIGPADIALRLAATFLAGALLGYNRGEHGHAAGLRTTMLVALAASASMILAFVLLPAQGHYVGFFTRMDVMRLPLGILSGIGFIGAGAIIHRGDVVRGVTTAATMWIVTMIGLVFGAGQFGFGAGLTILAFAVLWAIKLVEPHLPREHRAVLSLTVGDGGPNDDAIRSELRTGGFRIAIWQVSYADEGKERRLRIDLEWVSRNDQSQPPPCVEKIGRLVGVRRASWWPRGAGEMN
jgi:putative Mg2+ transporter-C (MgtC) family protein